MAASNHSPSSVSRVRRIALGLFLALAALEAYVLWPVCVPVPNEQLADFQPPISEREDAFLFGRVFQLKDGQWQQCKTRFSRIFFS